MLKNFNIVIAGVGGQGTVTLVKIIDEACFIEGYDVRSSELHGLAQRGGSVLAHIRFGKNIYSPMIASGSADLIIATELTEGLRATKFAGEKTKILVNKKLTPYLGGLSHDNILEEFPKKNLFLVEAPEFLGGIYLLGFAAKNNLVQLKAESFLKAIKKVIPEKYLELNIKAFSLLK